jgi:hypothetical protein
MSTRDAFSDGSFAYLLTQDIHYCVGVRPVCCAPCAKTFAEHSTWCSRAWRS